MPKTVRVLFFLAPWYFFSNGVFAQNIAISDTSSMACGGFFSDSGGGLGPYRANERVDKTLCPQVNGSGSHLRLSIPNLDLGTGDTLYIYDGKNRNAPLLYRLDQTWNNKVIIAQASVANADGCLTFRFVSDSQDQGDGWLAAVSCVQACQNFDALVLQSLPSPSIRDSNAIELCTGSELFLRAFGNYPQSNQSYPQSDTTTQFTWDFGDGRERIGRVVDHRYARPGVYKLRLTAIDAQGCRNTNFIEKLIYVAPRPKFLIDTTQTPTVCANDTVTLSSTIGFTNQATVRVESGELPPQANYISGDNTFITDNDGRSLESGLFVNEFAPDQVISNTGNLQSICINLEHSRLRDLEISLICPSGKSMILHNFVSVPGLPARLGQPSLNDDAAPRPGRGYNYCWKSTANNPDWLNFLDSRNIDSLPPGDYRPAQTLANFNGCPLNGEWKLNVRDQVTGENGFVFSWSMDFDPALSQNVRRLKPGIADLTWRFQPSIISQDDFNAKVVPSEGGLATYKLIATDSFGCKFDTTLSFRVRPTTDPACGNCGNNFPKLRDTVLCQGDSLALSFLPTNRLNRILSYSAFPQYSFNVANHPPDKPYAALLPISNLAFSTLTDPSRQIESVCLDLDSDWNSDLSISLRAPSGQVLLLSQGNGGASKNYTGTCFSTRSTNPITGEIGPFTGDFQPQGDWDNLRGANVNGNWALLVSDQFGSDFSNEIKNWSIQFRSVDSLTYSWTPRTVLTCTTCPNPKLFTNRNTKVRVSVTSRYGCVLSDSLNVSIRDTVAAPPVTCQQVSKNALQFNWGKVHAGSYEIRLQINGRDSLLPLPLPDTFLIVNRLNVNDQVLLRVRAFVPDSLFGCKLGVGSSVCTVQPCTLVATLDSVKAESCPGAEDAEFSLDVQGSFGLTQFNLIGPRGAIEPVRFAGLPSGNYQLLYRDDAGCGDTLQVSLTQNDSLRIKLDILQNITCAGEANGRISSTVIGGTGPFKYNWSGNSNNTQNISNLLPGDYRLTVTDANGCVGRADTTLFSPDAVNAQLSVRDVRCAGESNGGIITNAFGGTGNLRYTWNTGDTSATLNNLRPGNYCVSITDENGCQIERCSIIRSASLLQIDSIRGRPVSCPGDRNGSASIFVSGGRGRYQFQWSDSLAQISANATQLRAGRYGITVRDSSGCVIRDSVTVASPTPINVQARVLDVKCKDGDDGGARILASGGSAPYTFNWQTVNVNDSVATRLRAGVYVVSVTDSRGCRSQTQVTIQEPDNVLSVSAVQVNIGCFGQKLNTAQALPNGGSTGPYSFRWSNGQSSQIASNLDSINVTVTVTDRGGCAQTASVKLQDLPKMDPNMIISAPSCHGGSNGAIGINVIIGRPAADLNQYNFRWNNGQTGAIIRGLKGGDIYTVTITDPQGCQAVESRTVRQPRLITFDVVGDTLKCNGQGQGRIQVRNIVADTRSFTYRWDAAARSQTTAIANNLSAGTYAVTVTDEFGCFGVNTGSIREPEAIKISFQTTTPNCLGDTTGSIRTTVSGGQPNYTFRWSNGETRQNLRGISNGLFRVTVSDAQGCNAIATTAIEPLSGPTLNLQAIAPSCAGGIDGSIRITPSGGKAPYLLSSDGVNFRATSVLIGLKPGRYQVFVKDGNGCVFSENAVVEDKPALVLVPEQREYNIRLGDTLRLKAEAINAQGQVILTWEQPYAGALSCSVCPAPLVKTPNTATYIVNALDEKGCEAKAVVRVFIRKERIILVPTGFSPNGDGKNDLLLVHGQQGVKIKTFQVYDRWGELVYERINFAVNDALDGWNGFFREQAMPPGVYVWYLEGEYPDGFIEKKRGETTLLR
jgi:gliding motility-associated-like protein